MIPDIFIKEKADNSHFYNEIPKTDFSVLVTSWGHRRWALEFLFYNILRTKLFLHQSKIKNEDAHIWMLSHMALSYLSTLYPGSVDKKYTPTVNTKFDV